MKRKIFIDGSEGTTGLKIFDRFKERKDIEIMKIESEKRKDINERRRLINESDVTFLCLPDEAAKESAALAENDNVIVIDASTAHRTKAGWAYGFPELSAGHRDMISNGKKIAVPGCHATGFISLVFPLIKEGIIGADYPLTINSISGYSGAGKGMITEYEKETRIKDYDAPRLYALAQHHKHLPEMKKVCGLNQEPIFNPVIADYFQGMVVSVPLYANLLSKKYKLNDLINVYHDFYAHAKLIKVVPAESEAITSNFLCCNGMAGRDDLKIYLAGNDERIVLYAQFDNLGKGASGAAVQCMNIALGYDEDTGLVAGLVG
ncbi:MAG: N-acetyl-gamma-glutamyl-phosphate reductase [Lachnospiraceae bacterium]|nr:N-acetyl-gamma-glutamyl-phosphate reductase [Lachnospiraceae bacterium]